ncbi:grpE protein mitochondrial [Tripterygium wilfordii]|uniref:GrpE protein homolog n=1 Tax=Tripterygium wilfordii TaxID=458696 RepID=A0A7J7DS60_TRIWF|nr:protein GrpE-like [Tripterygium wilfordii]KAF5749141.1 grpE protein mitochondrial [Tripterygium wilfordii]
MATVLKTTPSRAPLPPRLAANSLNGSRPFCLSFRPRTIACKLSLVNSLLFAGESSLRFVKFVPLASQEGKIETAETEETLQEPEIEDTLDGAVGLEDSSSEEDTTEEIPASAIMDSLQSYKEALASNDEVKVSEVEAFLKSLEDEKIDQEKKVAGLSEELSIAKDKILRISADFDNFRKRTERDRLSLVTNAQGEVIENLLSVLDNFERAKTQIKVEKEGEEKINNSYQSIYKQFVEIIGSLGVVSVETIGKPFDPLLHEAIMREESTEYEEDIIIEEYRKGFKLGDRLLRPSMVKVSAGPGPAKPEEESPIEPEQEVPPEDEVIDESESVEQGSTEAGSA